MSTQQLIRVTDIPGLQAAGLPFKKIHQVRWAVRKAPENGTNEAFIRVGRAVYIDPDLYHALVRGGRIPKPSTVMSGGRSASSQDGA